MMAGLVIWVVFAFIFGLPVSAQPERAPPNPAFVQYLEDLRAGRPWPIVTPEGYYLGYIPEPVDLFHTKGIRVTDQRSFPSYYDLRALGRVPPIRDQGACGSCWAFATYGSLESWLLTAGQGSWDLSENNLKECHGFTLGSCEGGNVAMSTAYLSRRSGPLKEGTTLTKTAQLAVSLMAAGPLKNVLFIPPRAGPLDNDNLKWTIMNYGAVAARMASGLAFVFFASGFYVFAQSRIAPTERKHCLQEAVARSININSFAVDTYQALRGEAKNFFFPPYSIFLALAMTYAGARGDTGYEIARVLHVMPFQDRLPAVLEVLNQGFAARGEEGLRLYIVNSIWGQTGHPFLLDFLTLVNEKYGAVLREVDFRDNPEGSQKVINQWVSDETESRIEELIPPGWNYDLDKACPCRRYIFQGWLYPFDRAETRDDVFRLLNGQEIFVPMMHVKACLNYAAKDYWQAVELSYAGGKTTMLILLPNRSHFEEFESIVTAEWVEEIVAKLQKRDVCLAMPKFMYEGSLELKGILAELRMRAAFDPTKADFSGMGGTKDLYLDEVYHKAVVAVDEAGTEAVAATGVVVTAKAAPLSRPCIAVSVDRPFVFFIRDMETGVILVVGRILDPRQFCPVRIE